MPTRFAELGILEQKPMKNLRTFFAPVVLTLVITGSALGGETLTPPCAPGETLTPPCASAPVSGDPAPSSETQTSSQAVDLISLAGLALDMLLY